MNTTLPRLSLGLPVYNGARYLAESLEALLTQDLRDFELIVSDNASTDGSGDIAEDFARQDSRICVVRHLVNKGAAANFNFVFQAARAHYFKWVCADDRVAPGFLTRALAELEDNPEAVLCYGGITLIDEQGHRIGEYDQRLDLRSSDPVVRFNTVRAHRGMLNILQGIMRADSLRRTRPMGAFPASDEALAVELSLHGKFHEISHPMLFRRMHPAAASAGASVESRQEHLAPHSVGKVYLESWRRCIEDLRSTARAPVPLTIRMRLLGVMLRFMAREWRVLRWELKYGVQRAIRKRFPPRVQPQVKVQQPWT